MSDKCPECGAPTPKGGTCRDNLYGLLLPEDASAAMRNFHLGWNGFGKLAWEDFLRHREAFEQNAEAWMKHFSETSDLASNLVIFCKNRL